MPQVLLIFAAVWIGGVAVGWTLWLTVLQRGPGRDPVNTLLWWVVRIYCRIMHWPRVTNHVPWPDRDGLPHGLIVVANHTGAVDPLLVQASTVLHIRWMMGRDMMFDGLARLWTHQRMIPVDRTASDAGALRTAIRHVREGGVLGVFPEGRIIAGGGELRPFAPGVGMIIAKSRAPVLLILIRDTPAADSMVDNLTTRSRARIDVIDLIDYERGWKARAITDDLRQRLADSSGWPCNDEPLPPPVIESR